MRQTQLWLVVGSLITAALALFAFKTISLGFPVTPDVDADSWTIEAKLTFTGRDQPVRVNLAIPDDQSEFAVSDELFIASGFGTELLGEEAGRSVQFERRSQSGRAVLFYRARLISVDADLRRDTEETPRAVSDYRRSIRRRAIEENATPLLLALDDVLSEALEKSADEDSFIIQLARISDEADNERIRTIVDGGPPEISAKADRLVFLLNAAGTPARLVQGLHLNTETSQTEIESWIEYWIDNNWIAADPSDATPLAKGRFVPLAYNRSSIIEGEGARNLRLSWSTSRNYESQMERAMDTASETAPWITGTSLLNLPVDLQLVFRVLLLIPLGALVIVILKQLIGMPAFGTFMPVLIALAFRETELLAGIFLFTSIVAVGLMLRAYFSKLRLLLVPRLAAVLIIVTFLMMAIALISSWTGLPIGLSISLFPLVIITMTIERMSLVWEEDGGREAMTRAAGSLVGAALGYFVITNSQMEHIAFVFPELLLIVLALVILIGRYNGYKLSEFARFHVFADREDTRA